MIDHIPLLKELEKHNHCLDYKHLAPTELMTLIFYVEVTLIKSGFGGLPFSFYLFTFSLHWPGVVATSALLIECAVG